MKTNKRHPWPFIKVCGIQTEEEGLLALSCGANTIGLLVGLTHKATDEISVDLAARICARAHTAFPAARVAMVTHWLDPQHVKTIALTLGVDAIQIHDDMTPADVALLRRAVPDVELFKAVHIGAAGTSQTSDVLAYARAYAPFVDGFLTDSKSIDPDGRLRIGGTGKRHDPLVGQALVQAFPDKPVILAGGINHTNAIQAIRAIQPAGIDANSGLENPDGSKSADKITGFAIAGRTCPVLAPRRRAAYFPAAYPTKGGLAL